MFFCATCGAAHAIPATAKTANADASRRRKILSTTGQPDKIKTKSSTFQTRHHKVTHFDSAAVSKPLNSGEKS